MIDKEEAEKLMERPLDKGMLSGKETFIVHKEGFIYDEVLKLKSHVDKSTYTVTISECITNKVLFKDELKQHVKSLYSLKDIQQKYSDMKKLHAYHTHDPNTGALLRLTLKVDGPGFNAKYLYRSFPMFEEQQPSQLALDHEQKNGDHAEHDNGENKQLPLYLYGRIMSNSESDHFPQFSIFSIITGQNSDAPITSQGYFWKDVYQGIRVPQLAYAACVLDMEGNLLLKSKQDYMDAWPTFLIAPNVDADHAICCCIPLLPDGKTVWKVLGYASSIFI